MHKIILKKSKEILYCGKKVNIIAVNVNNSNYIEDFEGILGNSNFSIPHNTILKIIENDFSLKLSYTRLKNYIYNEYPEYFVP